MVAAALLRCVKHFEIGVYKDFIVGSIECDVLYFSVVYYIIVILLLFAGSRNGYAANCDCENEFT